MRIQVLLVTTVTLLAAPASAQSLSGPVLVDGGREFSFAVTQADPSVGGLSASGAVGSFRRTGTVNVSARLAYLGGRHGGAAGELSTFGSRRALFAGVDLGWMTGLGYDTDSGAGLYVPVGMTVSRAWQLRGVQVIPFGHARVSLAEIDPQEGEGGRLAGAAELGADVGVGSSWAIRAGLATFEDAPRLAIGVAYRP